MDRVNCVIIGAGVVGLAVARAIASTGMSVVIIENEESFGTHTSSRNSEVIHAGIYYPKNSLKAQLCVRGKHLLYRYCHSRNIPHKQIGKLIVATNESEADIVKAYIQKGADNDVSDLIWLDKSEVAKLEPQLKSTGAVFSPSTGIIDSHSFMLTLLGDAENSGAMIAYRTPFIRAEVAGNGFTVTTGGGDSLEFQTDNLVNAAGLNACSVAQNIQGMPNDKIPTPFYAKAHYYSLSGKNPFNHLIYPVAQKASLGIHVTLDIGGQARFGPDLDWIDTIDYAFDNGRLRLFYEAIRRYWPNIREENLQPGYTGIRPKISGPNESAADFNIQTKADHGVPGLINLFGIESPGLTSSLAIAEIVHENMTSRV